MKLIFPDSLADTLNAVNDVFFYGTKIGRPPLEDAAMWIASRHGLKGSYRGMFAPTKVDFDEGAHVFTGEIITTGAATAHILSEECMHMLNLIKSSNPQVQNAYHKADELLAGFIKRSDTSGWYCCAKCSTALWRNVASGGLGGSKKLLKDGLHVLKSRRDERGRWQGFPYYYTLLTLSEIDLPQAREELKYTLPLCEKLAKRIPGDDKFDERRYKLLKRVIEKS